MSLRIYNLQRLLLKIMCFFFFTEVRVWVKRRAAETTRAHTDYLPTRRT